MPDPIPHSAEKALAGRLRREAVQSRPEFSERLHARLCRAIRRHRAEAIPFRARRRVAALRPRRIIAAAVAAGLAGVAMIAWQAGRPTAVPELAGTAFTLPRPPAGEGPRAGKTGLAGLGSALDAVSDLSNRASGPIRDWLDSTEAAQQWACLDHDAQLTVQMLADRLPFDVGSSLALSSP